MSWNRWLRGCLRSLSPVLVLAIHGSLFTVHASEYLTPKVAGLANAMVAVADDNGAVFFNPAGMSQWERYATAFTFNMTPDREREFVGSIVDTITQPVGAGVAYVRHYELDESDRPGRDLHRGHLALSYLVYEGVSIGAAAKYLRMKDDKQDDLVKDGVGADAGVLYSPFEWGSVGFAGYNLVEIPGILPEGRREIAAGAALRGSSYVLATGQVRERPPDNTISEWSAALQATAFDIFDFRGGYRHQVGEGDAPDQKSLAFGFAWNAPKLTLAWGAQKQLESPKSLSHSLMIDVHF
ncbi:MAG: hypothetical protein HYY13_09255 [Nitrospirae bacterium]|nr:hypothetical protein [Nitrospirota bacterium]